MAVVRALVAVVRVAVFFVGALVFLFARLFLPGHVFGRPGPGGTEPIDLVTTFVYAFFAAAGLFLLLVGLWSFRLEGHVRRLELARLLFARIVVTSWAVLAVIMLVAMVLYAPVAEVLTIVGPVVAAGGILFALIPRRRARGREFAVR